MTQVADKENAAIFAEEALVVDAQVFLHNLMEEKGISRAELARRMGVSRARVTQMLSDECTNLTVRLLARAAYAMEETIELDCEHFRARRSSRDSLEAHSATNVSWLQDEGWMEGFPCGHNDDGRLHPFFCVSRERLAA